MADPNCKTCGGTGTVTEVRSVGGDIWMRTKNCPTCS